MKLLLQMLKEEEGSNNKLSDILILFKLILFVQLSRDIKASELLIFDSTFGYILIQERRKKIISQPFWKIIFVYF